MSSNKIRTNSIPHTCQLNFIQWFVHKLRQLSRILQKQNLCDLSPLNHVRRASVVNLMHIQSVAHVFDHPLHLMWRQIQHLKSIESSNIFEYGKCHSGWVEPLLICTQGVGRSKTELWKSSMNVQYSHLVLNTHYTSTITFPHDSLVSSTKPGLLWLNVWDQRWSCNWS